MKEATTVIIENEETLLDPDGEQQLQRILSRVPATFQLPKPGTLCPYTGKPRTSLRELIAPCKSNDFQPPVKAVYRKAHKHAQQGKWLIIAENLFRYILSQQGDSIAAYMEMAGERAKARGTK